MRKTGKEIIEFCDEWLSKNGKTVADMYRATGLKKETVSMWRSHPNTIPRVDSLILISDFTKLTVSEIIGQESPKYSSTILQIIRMAEYLNNTELKSVLAVTQTFYDTHIGEKREIG